MLAELAELLLLARVELVQLGKDETVDLVALRLGVSVRIGVGVGVRGELGVVLGLVLGRLDLELDAVA